MSIAQQQAAQRAIAALKALAIDMRRPRPADWTAEEATERVARRIEEIARELERTAHHT